jgi:hypothetical protein
MSYFISLDAIKRDQAFQIVKKLYNIAEYYAQESTTVRFNGNYYLSKKYYNVSKHNLIRAYKLASHYNFGIISKINAALTDMNIKINEL